MGLFFPHAKANTSTSLPPPSHRPSFLMDTLFDLWHYTVVLTMKHFICFDVLRNHRMMSGSSGAKQWLQTNCLRFAWRRMGAEIGRVGRPFSYWAAASVVSGSSTCSPVTYSPERDTVRLNCSSVQLMLIKRLRCIMRRRVRKYLVVVPQIFTAACIFFFVCLFF